MLPRPLGRARDVGDRPLVDDADRGQHKNVVREGEAHVLLDEQNTIDSGTLTGALLHGKRRRPFAEQIIDQVLAEDEARYKIYEEVRGRGADSSIAESLSEQQ